MRRIIGLDLGSKTVGVAKSDLLHTLASPHKTIYFKNEDYSQALDLTVEELSQFNVKNIGPRTKSINDTNIKSIYFRETPNVIFEK